MTVQKREHRIHLNLAASPHNQILSNPTVKYLMSNGWELVRYVIDDYANSIIMLWGRSVPDTPEFDYERRLREEQRGFE